MPRPSQSSSCPGCKFIWGATTSLNNWIYGASKVHKHSNFPENYLQFAHGQSRNIRQPCPKLKKFLRGHQIITPPGVTACFRPALQVPQSQSACSGGQKNLLHLPGIETQFLDNPAHKSLCRPNCPTFFIGPKKWKLLKITSICFLSLYVVTHVYHTPYKLSTL